MKFQFVPPSVLYHRLYVVGAPFTSYVIVVAALFETPVGPVTFTSGSIVGVHSIAILIEVHIVVSPQPLSR